MPVRVYNLFMISSRIPGLISPDTWDDGHRYAGRDKAPTIFGKDAKESKMLLEVQTDKILTL